MPFFLIFVVVPLMELTVFFYTSHFIGLGLTLLLCLLTAVIGGSMVRHQGLSTLQAAQNEMRKGNVPSKELFDGFCIVAAGALLLTPGFITDFIGTMLLLPPVRALLRRHLERSTLIHSVHITQHSRAFYSQTPANDPSVIEGEYERVDDRENRNNRAAK